MVSLTRLSLQILGKTQMGVFQISSQSLIKENCHNSRNSDNIDMKFEPVTKLDQKDKKTAKQFGGDVMSQIVTSLLFF